MLLKGSVRMSRSQVLLETVDVFETVLVRMSGRPESLLLALGCLQHLRSLTVHSPEVFAEVRRISEQVATEQHVAATRFEHIHAELAWRALPGRAGQRCARRARAQAGAAPAAPRAASGAVVDGTA